MNLKAKVEAVLFLTDKPMKAQAIARIVNGDVSVVRQLILELIHEYEERNGGLSIATDNGYIVEVKDEYAALMEEFLPIEMSAALLRTLSAIAIKQPIPQSEIIRIRGAGAYEHIRELMSRELVHKKEDGRSPILTTTKRFQEYFRLSRDGSSLRKFFKKTEKPVEPGSDDNEQLALPLTAEEMEKQQQIEAVLEQLLEVALDPAVDNDDNQDDVSAEPSQDLSPQSSIESVEEPPVVSSATDSDAEDGAS